MTIKIAILLEESLFERVDALAKELNISRSHLFALAVEEFIERHEKQHLLEAINAAYEDSPGPHERALRQEMHAKHRQLVEGQW
jgi:metal-responsive CopG/Arc/MetJ family transcriptional regulator